MLTHSTMDNRKSSHCDTSELKYVRAPQEITEARFLEMLHMMPPRDLYGSTGRQTFKLSEFIDGDITTLFCQVDGRCFELRDSYRLTHREIIAKCILG